MLHRRRLFALPLLAALSLMIGQGYLAGTCAPGSMPMAAMGGMHSSGGSGEPAARTSPCDALHADGPAHDGPACPFAGLFSHGCSVGASVAVEAPVVPASYPRGAALSDATAGFTPLLLAAPLFRPPRA